MHPEFELEEGVGHRTGCYTPSGGVCLGNWMNDVSRYFGCCGVLSCSEERYNCIRSQNKLTIYLEVVCMT